VGPGVISLAESYRFDSSILAQALCQQCGHHTAAVSFMLGRFSAKVTFLLSGYSAKSDIAQHSNSAAAACRPGRYATTLLLVLLLTEVRIPNPGNSALYGKTAARLGRLCKRLISNDSKANMHAGRADSTAKNQHGWTRSADGKPDLMGRKRPVQEASQLL
jgi:hypothetical protein